MERFSPPLRVEVLVTDTNQLAAVYAVLAGTPTVVTRVISPEQAADEEFLESEQWPVDMTSGEAEEVGSIADSIAGAAPEAERDVDGVPFDPALHTGTKLKSGQWRMKSGIERPTPTAAAQPNPGETPTPAPVPQTDPAASPSDAAPVVEEEDEFAAYARQATEAAPVAAADPAVRQWTDADLGTLCNQAALKLGGDRVDEIKGVIAKYVPEGVIGHSRNIPNDQREAFAQELEKLADIEFAG